MKLSNRVTYDKIDDDTGFLLLDGTMLEREFIGRGIEVQYEVYDCLLVILEVDLEHLAIYLLDRNGKTLDEQHIGHWYFDALFENPEIRDTDTLAFDFGKKGSVTVSEKPTRSSLFGKKRYLHFHGFTVES